MKNNTITPTGLLYLGATSEVYDQLIYASQSYGTFYAIYANIKTSAASTGERQIDEIKLRILNYKGVINLSLEKAEYNASTGTIDLFVKALGNTSKEILCKKLNKLRKKDQEKLVFVRHLIHLPNAHNNGIFEVEKYYRDGTYTEERPDYDSASPVAPGGRCMMSELKILT
mgnify:FL=1